MLETMGLDNVSEMTDIQGGKMGPNTEPWGTPQSSTQLGDRAVPIVTTCVRPQRYDLNHESPTPVKPYLSCIQFRRTVWSRR